MSELNEAHSWNSADQLLSNSRKGREKSHDVIAQNTSVLTPISFYPIVIASSHCTLKRPCIYLNWVPSCFSVLILDSSPRSFIKSCSLFISPQQVFGQRICGATIVFISLQLRGYEQNNYLTDFGTQIECNDMLLDSILTKFLGSFLMCYHVSYYIQLCRVCLK